MMKLNIQLFGHTNETDNYDLPQFVGTDKPTWLGDFNTAMASIDAGMAENASDITSLGSRVTSAESAASQASSDVASLTSTVSTLSTNVTSATTTANNAQSTATSALNTANTADGKADTNASAISALTPRVTACENSIADFNLTSFTDYASTDITKVSGTFTIATGSALTVATNSDGSLCKIYGSLDCRNVTATGSVSIATSLRPEEALTINGVALGLITTASGGVLNVKNLKNVSVTINTNGTVVFPITNVASGDNCKILALACLIFVKDFGDTPDVGE